MTQKPSSPGKIILFGSGETGKHGRRIQEEALSVHKKPVRVAILETPAGFQPNIDVVTGKLRTFFEVNLQNLQPIVTTVPARKRGSLQDPDNQAVADLLSDADVIFAGPGSPTYTVRQLRDSATLNVIRQRHREGATLVFASAAAIAMGTFAIPVYEIFKVGDDPSWLAGLDVLAEVGIRAAIVPHWNNQEGGADLDTSHCFIGRDRFQELLALLPPGVPIIGIEEHTALVIDPGTDTASVLGAGNVTTIIDGQTLVRPGGSVFELTQLTGRPVTAAVSFGSNSGHGASA